MTNPSRLYEWTMQKDKLVHVLEDYEIDLTPIASRADIKATLEKLRQQDFAMPKMIEEASDKLTGYVAWFKAEQLAKKIRDERQGNDEP